MKHPIALGLLWFLLTFLVVIFSGTDQGFIYMHF